MAKISERSALFTNGVCLIRLRQQLLPAAEVPGHSPAQFHENRQLFAPFNSNFRKQLLSCDRAVLKTFFQVA